MLAKALAPMEVIPDVFRKLVFKPPYAFRSKIRSIENKFPGAVSLFVWNKNGKLLEFPKEFSSKLISAFELMTRVFLLKEVDSDDYWQTQQVNPKFLRPTRIIQNFLGPHIQWDTILSGFGKCLGFTHRGKPAIVY